MPQQQTQNDGWNVVSTAPIPKANQPGGGWNVVSTSTSAGPQIVPGMSGPVAGMNGSGTPEAVPPQLANFSKSPTAKSVLKPSLLGRDMASTVAPTSPTSDTTAPDVGVIGNLAKGVAKSIPGTLSGITKLANKVPVVGPWMTDTDADSGPNGSYGAYTNYLDQAAQTNGTAQAVGKGLGNAAQFLIPGAGEEEGAEFLAPRIESAFKNAADAAKFSAPVTRIGASLAAPAARIGASALGAGTVNAAQGGSFLGGAAGGAIGGAVGEGARAFAPSLARTALGIKPVDSELGGATPGEAVLKETTGYSPRTIAGQANDKIEGLVKEAHRVADEAPNQEAQLEKARDIWNRSYTQAINRNNPDTIKGLDRLGDQLHINYGTGEAIPGEVPPAKLIDLKRGVADYRATFNPTTTPDFVDSTAGKVYDALDQELNRKVPAAAGLNQRISSLIPVADRARAAYLKPGFVQQFANRLGSPAGATLGAGFGGYEGEKYGGFSGALVGAGLGLVAPQLLLKNPTTLMTGARAMASPAMQSVAAPLVSAGTSKLLDAINPPANKRNYLIPPLNK